MIMGTDPTIDLLQTIRDGGWIVGLLIILWGGMKKWWVFGWQYRECVEEKNEWKTAALQSTQIAEAAASVGEHLAARNKALRGDN